MYCGLYSGFGLLEMMYAVWSCRDVVSPHVLVHLRETLLDVVLGAAFSHCGKSEPLRGMVQLQERNKPRYDPPEFEKALILINTDIFSCRFSFHPWEFSFL